MNKEQRILRFGGYSIFRENLPKMDLLSVSHPQESQVLNMSWTIHNVNLLHFVLQDKNKDEVKPWSTFSMTFLQSPTFSFVVETLTPNPGTC